MLTYFLCILIVLTISFFSVDKRAKKEYHLFFSIILIFTLTLFAGTRLVGYDFDVYLHHFKAVPDLFHYRRTDVSLEIGYELLVSLYKVFSDSFNGFLVCYAGITLIFALIACVKYSPIPLLSFGMFFSYAFFFQVMGQMRQPFAILFLYLTLIPLILKKKYVAGCVLILLCAFFLHKSSILCLAVLFFADRKLSRKQILYCGLLTCVMYVLSPQLIKLFMLLIPKSIPLYAVFEAYTTYKSIQVSFSLGMLERIGMFIVLYYFATRQNLYQTDPKLRLFINTYFMGVCIYFSFISVAAEFATRGTFFYVYSLFFAIPVLISKSTIKAKYILYAITVLWCIYLASGIITKEENKVFLPYNSTLFYL